MLQPHCIRINIAGSLRRERPEVKDIEIVCQPATVTQEVGDLFGASLVKVISPRFVELVKTLGQAVLGQPSGRNMKINLKQGITLDLFMPTPEDYYRQYAIRTGSADYAHQTIAAAWKRLGWCGSDKGLRKMADCIETKGPDGKSKWVCMNPNAEKPPVWESEADFFRWLGVPLIMPKLRTL